MRILLVSEDPAMAGGIAGYSVATAAELAARGHDVAYLHSGGPSGQYDWLLRRRWTSTVRDGVVFDGLRNARSIGVHTGLPLLDVEGDDSRWIERRAASHRPDIIHVHSLLAIPFETIARLASLAPVVLSVHEFGLICQRRVLVQRGHVPCRSYAEQSECAACVDTVSPSKVKLRARLGRTPGSVALRGVYALERALRADFVVATLPVSEPSANGAAAEPFRRRLSEGVRIVNGHVRRVLAVSQAVRDVLLEVGVEDELVHVLHIGSRSADSLESMPLPSEGNGDVTFMYLGGLTPSKGPHVLMEALRMMDRPPRVIVAGWGSEWYERQLREAAPSWVEFVGAYRKEDLPDLLAQVDVVVAPAIGPDTSPQVVLEALAAGRPVLASRVGGIPDFVQDGVNGLLVEPDDAGGLAAAIAALMDRGLVNRLAAGAKREKTMEQHVGELEGVYACLD